MAAALQHGLVATGKALERHAQLVRGGCRPDPFQWPMELVNPQGRMRLVRIKQSQRSSEAPLVRLAEPAESLEELVGEIKCLIDTGARHGAACTSRWRQLTDSSALRALRPP